MMDKQVMEGISRNDVDVWVEAAFDGNETEASWFWETWDVELWQL